MIKVMLFFKITDINHSNSYIVKGFTMRKIREDKNEYIRTGEWEHSGWCI